MAQIINTDTKASPAGSPRPKLPKKSWQLIVAVVVLVIIVVAIAIYVSSRNSNSDKYDYKYKNLGAATTTLLSAPKGSTPPGSLSSVPDVNLKFQKPPELQLAANSPVSDASNYSHQFNGQTVASMSILMYTYGGDYGKITEPIIAASLKKAPDTSDYKAAVTPLTAFVDDHLPDFSTTVYSLNLGPAQTLTTPYAKTEAWQFDVTTTLDASALNKPYIKNAPSQFYKNWQGKLLYVWTSSHLYYVLLDSIQQNWQPNISTWQQIINSIQFS